MSPTDRTCWETPPEIFERFHSVFGFTLDVCALPHNAKHQRFFTPDEDGLQQTWAPHVCWMNPPYGRGIAAWLAKARAEAEKGATVVALLPDDQSTRWFHDHVHRIADVWPLDGRVKFVGAAGSPNFGSIIAIYWPAGFWRGTNRKETL
jgi:site-specific DNA-methyltransferase (adenine-specific)